MRVHRLKNRKKHQKLLGLLWIDPAGILRGKRARVLLQMMRISSRPVEVHRSSGRKMGKKPSKNEKLPAEVLCGEWARVWLQMLRIWLGQVCGSSGQKMGKNHWFLPFFILVRAMNSR